MGVSPMPLPNAWPGRPCYWSPACTGKMPVSRSSHMSELAIVPFDSRELPGVLEVLTQAMHADAISESRFARQVLLDPNFRPEGAPIARLNGRVIGFCLSIARQLPLENAAPDHDRGYITLLAVKPSEQRHGIGTRLLA